MRDLGQACVDGNVDLLKRALAAGADVSAACFNCCGEDEQRGFGKEALEARGEAASLFTAAYVAAYNGCDEILRHLLEVGKAHPDFGQAESTGSWLTPLHAACCRGEGRCVRVLFDYCVDPTLRDVSGRTGEEMASEFADRTGNLDALETFRLHAKSRRMMVRSQPWGP